MAATWANSVTRRGRQSRRDSRSAPPSWRSISSATRSATRLIRGSDELNERAAAGALPYDDVASRQQVAFADDCCLRRHAPIVHIQATLLNESPGFALRCHDAMARRDVDRLDRLVVVRGDI